MDDKQHTKHMDIWNESKCTIILVNDVSNTAQSLNKKLFNFSDSIKSPFGLVNLCMLLQLFSKRITRHDTNESFNAICLFICIFAAATRYTGELDLEKINSIHQSSTFICSDKQNKREYDFVNTFNIKNDSKL